MIKFLISMMFTILFTMNDYASEHINKRELQLNNYNFTDIICDSKGDLYLATENAGLFKSEDEGNSWTLTNSITTRYTLVSIMINDYEGIILGTDEGELLQSTDRGKSWRVRNVNVPALTVLSTNKRYKMFGSKFGGIIMSMDNENCGYSYCYKDDIIYPKISCLLYTKEGVLYAGGSAIMRNDKIEDWGDDWIDIRNGMKLTSFCIIETSDNRILVGTSNGIYYTVNKGASWNIISPYLQKYLITSICETKNGRLVIGTDSCGIFISDDKGKTWEQINQPKITSRINKIFELKKDILFALTRTDGLLKSYDNGNNWSIIDSNWNISADSIINDGWIPSINFYDEYVNLGQINFIKFLQNDSILVLKGSKFKFFNALSGQMINDYQFPDSLHVYCYYFYSLDSVLIASAKSKIQFGILSTSTNEFKSLISLDSEYFRSKFAPDDNRLYNGFNILSTIYNHDKKSLLIKYVLNGVWNWTYDPIRENIEELRNIETGKLIKTYDFSTAFSTDMKYYMVNNLKLFDYNDNFIYDISKIPENYSFLSTASITNSKISPNNKFIILYSFNQNIFLIVDFKSGRILREIQFPKFYPPTFNVSFDDNYLFTASDESAIKIYNLYNSSDAFDKVLFFPGGSSWFFDVAQNSSCVAFGGFDGVMRLWRPNLLLTSIKENDNIFSTKNDILISPNPAIDFIEITEYTGCSQFADGFYVRIYNILGQEFNLIPVISISEEGLSDKSSSRYSLRIDISSLSPGVYFIRVGDKVSKFVKVFK